MHASLAPVRPGQRGPEDDALFSLLYIMVLLNMGVKGSAWISWQGSGPSMPIQYTSPRYLSELLQVH
eukprot:1159925-Pelagomonas_calceolata.AAC.4